MKKLISLLTVALLSCAGYDDSYDSIGQNQEPWQIRASSVATWGVRTDGVRTRCDLGTTNQTCTFTSSAGTAALGQNHQMIFPIKVDFTGRTEWQSEMEALVDAFCTQMQNTINMTPNPVNNFSCYRVNSAVGAKLLVKPSALNTQTNSLISNFGSLTFASTFTLTETLNGSYMSAGSATVRLDPTVITDYAASQGWNNTQKATARKRVLWHYLLAAIGVGSQNTSSGFASYGNVTNTTPSVLTVEERCRIRNIDWDENNRGVINALTGC